MNDLVKYPMYDPKYYLLDFQGLNILLQNYRQHNIKTNTLTSWLDENAIGRMSLGSLEALHTPEDGLHLTILSLVQVVVEKASRATRSGNGATGSIAVENVGEDHAVRRQTINLDT